LVVEGPICFADRGPDLAEAQTLDKALWLRIKRGGLLAHSGHVSWAVSRRSLYALRAFTFSSSVVVFCILFYLQNALASLSYGLDQTFSSESAIS
jgi:hypothetical protein